MVAIGAKALSNFTHPEKAPADSFPLDHEGRPLTGEVHVAQEFFINPAYYCAFFAMRVTLQSDRALEVPPAGQEPVIDSPAPAPAHEEAPAHEAHDEAPAQGADA